MRGCSLLAMSTSCRARYFRRNDKSGNLGPSIRVIMFRPHTPNRIEVKKTGRRYRNTLLYKLCGLFARKGETRLILEHFTVTHRPLIYYLTFDVDHVQCHEHDALYENELHDQQPDECELALGDEPRMTAEAAATAWRCPQNEGIFLRAAPFNKVTFSAHILDKQRDQLIGAKKKGKVGEHVAEDESFWHVHREQ